MSAGGAHDQSTNPWRHCEWQDDGRRPRDHATVVVLQSAVRDESPARAGHSGDIVARHISRHCRFPDLVCGASMVGDVFISWSWPSWLASASEETPRLQWQRPAVELFNSADDDFFNRIKINSSHVLQPYLPDKINLPYQLRSRSNNKTLINKTKLLNSSYFIVPLLYKYSY